MNTKPYKYLFLEHSMLGQKINIQNENEVIDKCIRLAYIDMLSAGRYYKLDNTLLDNFKQILLNNLNDSPIDIIKKSLNIFGNKGKIYNKNKTKYVTRYGLCQKLVNMAFKYFFIFSDYTQLNIDFSKCDCPLDSVILDKINYRETVWSKLDKNQYIKCQDQIKNELSKICLNNELKDLGNLAYDFINW